MISARRNFSTDRHRTPSSRAFPLPRVSRSLVKKRSRAAQSRVPVLARLGTLITRESSSPLSPSFPRRSFLAFAVSPRVARRGGADLDPPRLACARARASALVSLPFVRSFAFALLVRHRSIDRASRSSPRHSIVLDASSRPRSFVHSFAINQSINQSIASPPVQSFQSNRIDRRVVASSRRVSSSRLVDSFLAPRLSSSSPRAPPSRSRTRRRLTPRAPASPSTLPIIRLVSSRLVAPRHLWMDGWGGVVVVSPDRWLRWCLFVLCL